MALFSTLIVEAELLEIPQKLYISLNFLAGLAQFVDCDFQPETRPCELT